MRNWFNFLIMSTLKRLIHFSFLNILKDIKLFKGYNCNNSNQFSTGSSPPPFSTIYILWLLFLNDQNFLSRVEGEVGGLTDLMYVNILHFFILKNFGWRKFFLGAIYPFLKLDRWLSQSVRILFLIFCDLK